MWLRARQGTFWCQSDIDVGEYGQIFRRSFVQKIEDERMGDTGRKRVQYISEFTELGGEREGEASVRITFSINCFVFLLYPLSTKI